MLIRIEDDTLRECPDDLAALILASPDAGKKPQPFSIDAVNALIHWTLGAFADENLTWEANLKNVRDAYEALLPISPEQLDAAMLLIENYNKNIKVEDIGRVDPHLLYPPEVSSSRVISHSSE